MLQSRAEFGCAWVNNASYEKQYLVVQGWIYVFGGIITSPGYFNQLKIIEMLPFNYAFGSFSFTNWEPTTSALRIPRYGHHCNIFQSYIYCIGGTDGYNTLASVEIFDLHADKIADIYLNEARFSPMIAIFNDRLIVFGGGPAFGGGHASDSIEKLSLTSSPTPAPTFSPTNSTKYPSNAPSDSPTDSPSNAPTFAPTINPTISTESPTFPPTIAPIFRYIYITDKDENKNELIYLIYIYCA
eukprot:437631_1